MFSLNLGGPHLPLGQEDGRRGGGPQGGKGMPDPVVPSLRWARACRDPQRRPHSIWPPRRGCLFSVSGGLGRGPFSPCPGQVAACLLLFLEEEDAFWMMCAIIEDLLPASYFSTTLLGVQTDQRVLRHLIVQYLPRLDKLLQEHDIGNGPTPPLLWGPGVLSSASGAAGPRPQDPAEDGANGSLRRREGAHLTTAPPCTQPRRLPCALVLWGSDGCPPSACGAGRASCRFGGAPLRLLRGRVPGGRPWPAVLRQLRVPAQGLRCVSAELSLITLHWFLTAFASVVHIKLLLRLWDLFFYEGSLVLFQTTLGMLRLKVPARAPAPSPVPHPPLAPPARPPRRGRLSLLGRAPCAPLDRPGGSRA